MTWFIFFGDMLVMAFMTGLAIWFTYRGNAETLDYIARIPLDEHDARDARNEENAEGSSFTAEGSS